MQGTNPSDGTYGADPHGGVPYAYGYGDGYGGSTAIDTDAAPWEPAQYAHSAEPTGYVDAAGPNPAAAWPHLYVLAPDAPAVGPGPDTAGWDAGHGDVLTVPPPEGDTPDLPVPGPDAPKGGSKRPVFVDSSGRRQRRVLRAARLLVIPAGGYVALLISTVLGGPSLSAPFVPQPDATHPATPRATAPDIPAGTGHTPGSAPSAARQTNSRPTPTQKTSGSADRSTASAATPTPTEPTAVDSPSSAPTATPTPTRTSKGRAVGSSHNPVK
ncbi:hypothetical protein ACFVHS_13155 [Streptomyces sp. NPDC057746]|uniref:hypothetical protein n=1 Tax=Streptomyces sp. NPDC057746 TaxID=3346237 RepID=UPI003684C3BF